MILATAVVALVVVIGGEATDFVLFVVGFVDVCRWLPALVRVEGVRALGIRWSTLSAGRIA